MIAARAARGTVELPDAHLGDELLTLVIAGHEPTATAIARRRSHGRGDLLAHNRDVARTLRAALAAGGKGNLKATAKEVLRARTAVYASAARRPLEPTQVC